MVQYMKHLTYSIVHCVAYVCILTNCCVCLLSVLLAFSVSVCCYVALVFICHGDHGGKQVA